MLVNVIKKVLNAVVPVLFIAGGILLILQGVLYTRYQKEYVPVTGVISDIVMTEEGRESHYETYVKYTVDETSYESSLGSYSSSYTAGSEIALLYDPADPGSVVPAGNSAVMFFVSGAVALALGALAVWRLFASPAGVRRF